MIPFIYDLPHVQSMAWGFGGLAGGACIWLLILKLQDMRYNKKQKEKSVKHE